MKSKFSFLLGLVFGASAGGAAVWYLIKDKYEAIAQEEIDSVKSTYAAQKEAISKELEACRQELEENRAMFSEPKDKEKTAPGSDSAKAEEIARKRGYTDYSRSVVPPKAESTPEKSDDGPYVIAPLEFGELGYARVSYTLYADGVVSDVNGVVVDNVEEMFGDALHHFGEFEDDSVYVRNDIKGIDYEILKSLDTFDEFLNSLHERGG